MWLLSIFSTNTYSPFPSDISFATAGPAYKTGLVQVGDVLFEVDHENGMSLLIILNSDWHSLGLSVPLFCNVYCEILGLYAGSILQILSAHFEGDVV